MNNDYGFENRKAFLERSRDERILNSLNMSSHQLHPQSRVAKQINRFHKQGRFDNTIRMNNMHKENFNMNFNKKI